MLSHEIRTPLTSIRESVNLIGEGLMGEINDRQRKFLDIATLEMKRVSELLNRIMQVSYLESGALELDFQKIDPTALAAECVEQMKPAAETKKIDIKLEPPQKMLFIIGDPKYLQQAFINLLGNAIKFSPENSQVRLIAETDQGRIKFSIVDNGPGVPKNEKPFIFNKYYRAKGVRGKSDGAGLGLSITRHIVEAHGGRIWVKSGPNGGAAMVFTLPARLKEHML
jgi:signal transduction histidine kinase